MGLRGDTRPPTSCRYSPSNPTLGGTMSGHVVARKRRWPWAILSLLFAMAFAGSFAVTADGRTMLQIGLAVGLVLSLLRLALTSISSRRARRAQEADQGQAEADEGTETGADDRARSYEEVFGVEVEIDEDSLPLAPEEEGSPVGEGTAVEAEGDRSSEAPTEGSHPTSEPASEEDLQPVPADLDEAVDQVEPVDTDDEPADTDDEFQEHLRRMREEFRARAEDAALRVKQREAELHEAASGADQER